MMDGVLSVTQDFHYTWEHVSGEVDKPRKVLVFIHENAEIGEQNNILLSAGSGLVRRAVVLYRRG